MKPLLSIVVPTKDRYEYLIPLISLIKSFDSDEIELVIQDNTKDNSEITKYIDECDYSHLKYFHTTEQLSAARNSDLAILNSTGKYICFIGDDDGVSAHIVSAVKWMEQKNIDVLKSAMVSYKWPSFSFSRVANFSSVFMMSFYDKKYKKIDALAELKKCLRTGGSKIKLLPKVYHGIAKRTTLDKIYKIGDTFFPGPSPDIANGVALCFLAENFVFLNFPVVIPGNSNRTGGDVQKHKGLHAKISEIPFLPLHTDKNWEKFIPKIWSCETIMPETACKSLQYMGKEEYINKYLNKERMLADFIIGHLPLRKIALSKSSNKLLLFYYIILLFSKKLIHALLNKVLFSMLSIFYRDSYFSGGYFNKKNYSKVFKNILSIEDANSVLLEKESEFIVEE